MPVEEPLPVEEPRLLDRKLCGVERPPPWRFGMIDQGGMRDHRGEQGRRRQPHGNRRGQHQNDAAAPPPPQRMSADLSHVACHGNRRRSGTHSVRSECGLEESALRSRSKLIAGMLPSFKEIVAAGQSGAGRKSHFLSIFKLTPCRHWDIWNTRPRIVSRSHPSSTPGPYHVSPLAPTFRLVYRGVAWFFTPLQWLMFNC